MLLALTAWALLQAPAAPPAASSAVDTFAADVRRLTEAADNDQRFEALTTLLKEKGVAFVVEPFTVDKQQGRDTRTRGRNVVATIGQGPREIVVGAHFDAVWLPDGAFGRGAVDNAASSVMLAHAAAAVQALKLPLRVTFVWFDMEEGGLIGSARYVAAHAAAPPRAMLNFDINGYGDTVIFAAPSGGADAALRQAMQQACASETIDCVRFDQMPPSDDRSFGREKVPTLSIAQLPAVEVHQLWLMMHGGQNSGLAQGVTPSILRTIHTADDVAAKIESATLARGQRLALALLRQIAALP